jgi:hypothetical protein
MNITGLNDFSGVHHSDPIRNFSNNAQVMRNKDNGKTQIFFADL